MQPSRVRLNIRKAFQDARRAEHTPPGDAVGSPSLVAFRKRLEEPLTGLVEAQCILHASRAWYELTLEGPFRPAIL